MGDAYTWISNKGSLEEGLKAYKKAEELDQNNIIYINFVGDMLIRMGKYDEAILQFQKTLRIPNESGYANLSIAKAYKQFKIYNSAREHYQKAIEVFSRNNKDGQFDKEILEARKEIAQLPK